MQFPNRITSLGILAFVALAALILFTALFSAIRAPFSTLYDHHAPFTPLSIVDLGFVNDPVLNDGGIFREWMGEPINFLCETVLVKIIPETYFLELT